MARRPDPPQPEVPLADYLCLALYRTSREVTGLYRDWLEPLDLTYPQYLVMRLLWQSDAGVGLGVGHIAEAIGLDYGTLSPMLKRLEAAGLIERRRRPDDERAVEVHLTAAGHALETRAADIPGKLTATLGLDATDTRTLQDLLTRISQSIAATRATRTGSRRL